MQTKYRTERIFVPVFSITIVQVLKPINTDTTKRADTVLIFQTVSVERN